MQKKPVKSAVCRMDVLVERENRKCALWQLPNSVGRAHWPKRANYEALGVNFFDGSPALHCSIKSGAFRVHQNGLLRFSVNEENMILKLMLILSSSLILVSTECCR